jgi:hypothetical protein
MTDTAPTLVDSGLAYCRVHHGVVECDEGDLCCDMADGVDLRRLRRRPSAVDEGCDLTPLLYLAGGDGS